MGLNEKVCKKLEMADPKNSNHVAMFPWFGFGHFIPFLHLSNKLAEKGYKVSYLLPKGAQPKLSQLNQHPNLIHFFPLVVPHVEGLPPGAETCSDVPYPLHDQLCTALDLTRDQVKAILAVIKPNFVLFDVAYWIPALGRELGFKSVMYATVCAAGHSLRLVPAMKIVKGMSFEEMMQTPPGYPSSTVVPRPDEVAQARSLAEEFGSGLSKYDRLVTSKEESDAIALRTCREFEGPFIDYMAQQFGKPVLLAGPVLPEDPLSQLEEKWHKWLSKFEAGSVVFCAFGSQIKLKKNQFQELLLAFELSGLPFLVALAPPEGCSTIEEAIPEGFEKRVQAKGWVYGDWVPQPQILGHPSVGCFVSHCGFSSMWEALQSDCQIVLAPHLGDQIVNTMLLVKEHNVAVEVEREGNGWISKENLNKAIKSVMDNSSEVAQVVKSNRYKLKKVLFDENMQESYIDSFTMNLQALLIN
ncbi:hypothetical protein P3X46_014801 [Hevea brasiliensis]|uniref:Glycosyltransferase n=1 Tax=Hevea brasiliensis TaxID=3981 RepID=A0ABQ9LTZ5_HEVBR|nr:UDP-glycosyltransferase 79B6 [Hevea brasiliensis]KAJ9171431.1 hypothetical protein P3X46_014801 [Hevea brasiliensis]